MTEVDVSYTALAAAASGHDELSGRAARARSDAEAADLPSGSLGKLPQSDEILAAFQERRSLAMDALAALEESFTNTADNLRATLEQYRAVDDSTHQVFGGGQ